MLNVVTAADETDVTTLDAVKEELNVTSDTEKSYLERKISEATDAICEYLNVKRADDGSRTIAQETLEETFRGGWNGRIRCRHDSPRMSSLILARWPVTAITSVVEDGTTLDPSQYECTASGVLKRLSGSPGIDIGWSTYTTKMVTYTAGWIMPGVGDSRTLPRTIEAAAFLIIKSARVNRGRDAQMKRESFGQRAYEYEIFQDTSGSAGIPAEARTYLDRYRKAQLG